MHDITVTIPWRVQSDVIGLVLGALIPWGFFAIKNGINAKRMAQAEKVANRLMGKKPDLIPAADVHSTTLWTAENSFRKDMEAKIVLHLNRQIKIRKYLDNTTT